MGYGLSKPKNSDELAVDDRGVADAEPHPLSPCQNFFQFCFALFKEMLPIILPVQFERVETMQEHLVVMGIGMQLVEVRFAVLPSPNRFPVHDDRADRSEGTVATGCRA